MSDGVSFVTESGDSLATYSMSHSSLSAVADADAIAQMALQ
ncbi:hypothetical protein CCUG62472_00569 [Mycobacteroides salmoniphilum]|nr:hypothetical protein CCUG62472_00569 [Mycobacteroides salmoniphilum]